MLTDGPGRAVTGAVVAAGKQSVTVEVAEQLVEPAPAVRFVVVQALAKGDRGELAVELLTEVGVSEILPWQAARSDRPLVGRAGRQGLGPLAEHGARGRQAVPPAVGTHGRRADRHRRADGSDRGRRHRAAAARGRDDCRWPP